MVVRRRRIRSRHLSSPYNVHLWSLSVGFFFPFSFQKSIISIPAASPTVTLTLISFCMQSVYRNYYSFVNWWTRKWEAIFKLLKAWTGGRGGKAQSEGGALLWKWNKKASGPISNEWREWVGPVSNKCREWVMFCLVSFDLLLNMIVEQRARWKRGFTRTGLFFLQLLKWSKRKSRERGQSMLLTSWCGSSVYLTLQWVYLHCVRELRAVGLWSYGCGPHVLELL